MDLDSVGLTCVAGSFEILIFQRLFMPIFLALLLAVAWKLQNLARDKRATGNDFLTVAGGSFFVFFMAIIGSCLDVLICTKHPDGSQTLAAYRWVECELGDTEWGRVSWIAVAALVLYLFSAASVIGGVIVLMQSKGEDAGLEKKKEARLQSLCFVYSSYRHRAYYWAAVVATKDFCFAATALLSSAFWQALSAQRAAQPLRGQGTELRRPCAGKAVRAASLAPRGSQRASACCISAPLSRCEGGRAGLRTGPFGAVARYA